MKTGLSIRQLVSMTIRQTNVYFFGYIFIDWVSEDYFQTSFLNKKRGNIK